MIVEGVKARRRETKRISETKKSAPRKQTLEDLSLKKPKRISKKLARSELKENIILARSALERAKRGEIDLKETLLTQKKSPSSSLPFLYETQITRERLEARRACRKAKKLLDIIAGDDLVDSPKYKELDNLLKLFTREERKLYRESYKRRKSLDSLRSQSVKAEDGESLEVAEKKGVHSGSVFNRVARRVGLLFVLAATFAATFFPFARGSRKGEEEESRQSLRDSGAAANFFHQEDKIATNQAIGVLPPNYVEQIIDNDPLKLPSRYREPLAREILPAPPAAELAGYNRVPDRGDTLEGEVAEEDAGWITMDSDLSGGSKKGKNSLPPGPGAPHSIGELSASAQYIRGKVASNRSQSAFIGATANSLGDLYFSTQANLRDVPINLTFVDSKEEGAILHLGGDIFARGSPGNGIALYGGVNIPIKESTSFKELNPHIDLRGERTLFFRDLSSLALSASLGHQAVLDKKNNQVESRPTYSYSVSYALPAIINEALTQTITPTLGVASSGVIGEESYYLNGWYLGFDGSRNIIAKPMGPFDVDLKFGIFFEGSREFNPNGDLSPGVSLGASIEGRYQYNFFSLGAKGTTYFSDNQPSPNLAAMVSYTRILLPSKWPIRLNFSCQWVLEEGTATDPPYMSDWNRPGKNNLSMSLTKSF
jgi:hypothetical protein